MCDAEFAQAFRSQTEADLLKPGLMELKMEPDVEQQELSRRDKLQSTLKDNVSQDSLKRVETILEQVSSLNSVERLYLYLKLPGSSSSSRQGQPGDLDPLRQPLNPLGSRAEIGLTINWIRTHLEEDPQVSLPKHEVYEEYLSYCATNNVKPLSTADFGKVMKQVYPQVRPRRLGTRGNSRYCYAGLRKRTKLEVPLTPDISQEGRGGGPGELPTGEEEQNSASSFLIREWVEKILGVKFESLTELALHLLEKMYVDNRSSAAYTLLSANPPRFVGTITPRPVLTSPLPDSNKMQPLNQRVEPKRKLSSDLELVGKKPKSQNIATQDSRFAEKSPEHVQNNLGGNIVYAGDVRVSQPQDFSRIVPVPRPPSSISMDKLPRKKQALAEVCLESGIILHTLKPEDKIVKVPVKYKEVEWPEPGLKTEDTEAWPEYDEPADLTTHQFYVTDKLGSGGSSSDAQEEELARYFTQGDLEATNPATLQSESKKLSQLRELLEKNLKAPPSSSSPLGGGAFKRTSLPLRDINKVEVGVVVSSSMEATPTLSNRRRVTFNHIVCDPSSPTAPVTTGSCPVPPSPGTGTCPVPPSPGTRRRHYSFQPISPKSAGLQSPPASPFVSPRSTPVHMLRSRHSSGSALPLYLLPGGGGRNHHPSGNSDVSRAATYGSASESSTPFISPQGTPIPFNRSRHNSAQPRLCRSRHSSGLSLGTQYTNNRFNTMPYSPGALSNLNNPFSPQPSTPVLCPDSDPTNGGGFLSGVSLSGGMNGGGGLAADGSGTVVTFNSGVGGGPLNNEDPRSRHSSAGSDCQAPHSAPLSPYNTGPPASQAVRVRHQSAGAATATIHYRPSSWQTNGGFTQSTIQFTNEGDGFHGGYSNHTSGSQPPTPSPLEAGLGQTFTYTHSLPNQTADYRTTEYVEENGDLDLLMGGGGGDLDEGGDEGGGGGGHHHLKGGRKEGGGGDELDLALSALRDCDTDFSKFLPEVGGTTGSS